MTQFRCGHERFINVIENEDRPYLYDVGGEQKETVPMTKELRQWLQSFIAVGGRGLNTFAEIREITKHYAGQVMICFENNAIYQYQSVTTEDNGSTCLKPDNVDSLMNGRWILKTYLTDTAYNIWSVLKYDGDVVENVTLYVDNVNGTDDVINDGTELLPFKTIQYAIDTYVYSRGYWKGTLIIRLIEDYADVLSLVGLIGNGSLVIQSNDAVKKNVSAGEYVTVKNNQVKIALINIEATSMLVQNSDVAFIAVITGDGTVTNSKINISQESVFSLDVDYCDIVTFEAQINSVINHSNLIAEALQAGGSIDISNSVIASDGYNYIAIGVNCNHNRVSTLNTTDKTFYVANITGIDSASTTGDITHPFKTIEYAISRYLDGNDSIDGNLTITLQENHAGTPLISYLKGVGSITINGAFDCNIDCSYSNVRILLNDITGGSFNLSNCYKISFVGVICGGDFNSDNVVYLDISNMTANNGIVVSKTPSLKILNHTGAIEINDCNATIRIAVSDITANYSSLRQVSITGTVTNNHSLISV